MWIWILPLGVQLEKIKFISTREHVIFIFLYKHTDNDVFDDFPKISEHFLNICEDSKIVPRARQRFPNILRRLPKVTEDFWGGTDVSIIQQYIWALFSDYVAIAMAILRLVTKTCCFHVWRNHVIFMWKDIMFMHESSPGIWPVYCPLTKLNHVSCVGV